MASMGQEIRANYPQGSYQVAGVQVKADQLKVRAMNFGQHWRGEDVQNLPYTIRLPVRLAVDILEWQLPDCIQDAKEYPDDQDLTEQLLKKEGWPTDGNYLLSDGPELLRQLLLEEYAHEMLLQWLGDGAHEKDGYVINTCDSIGIENGAVLILGQCRATGTSSAYQDF